MSFYNKASVSDQRIQIFIYFLYSATPCAAAKCTT